jgi:hypothetical protein
VVAASDAGIAATVLPSEPAVQVAALAQLVSFIPIETILLYPADAFAVWALALAGTPLRDICGYNHSSWGPVLLLVLRKDVSWEKVLVSS